MALSSSPISFCPCSCMLVVRAGVRAIPTGGLCLGVFVHADFAASPAARQSALKALWVSLLPLLHTLPHLERDTS